MANGRKMKKEETLVIIKPDTLCQRVVGKVISIIEENGLKIKGLKMIKLNKKDAKNFYIEHKGKDFYTPLVNFMSSNPCIVMVVSGNNAIKKLRKIAGKTDPKEAKPMTIRRMFARDGRHNIVHASDSKKSAKREIKFFFKRNEIFDWKYINYKL